jgi:hypothetical protein
METRPRRLPKIADQAKIEVPAIMFHIAQEWTPGLSAEQLYERTRRYWNCDPGSQTVKPTHAIAFAGGLVRAVYKIDDWVTYTRWPDDRDFARNKGIIDLWDDGSRK